jgi:Immunity protein 7
MHEFHAWIGLSESTEESDLGGLQDAVDELQELAADSQWHDAIFEIRNLNGQYFMTADGMVNRRREEGERLDLFIATIARKLPGSWGLIYERDDEMSDPPGSNAFRVRVLARGRIVERPDPFLSPCNPVIEDLT